MGIIKRELEQAFSDYGKKCGGCKEDYFAVLYLAKKFRQQLEDIFYHVAFGGNDYGIDAFHIDKELHNLYLFQFKWSESYNLFKDSFKRLISKGMERVFGNPLQDQDQNQLLIQLKSELHENQAVIDRVFIHFVFNGDPAMAEQSVVLDSLREDLESKKYLIDQYFANRQIDLAFEFISNETRKLASVAHVKKTHKYNIGFDQRITSKTASGEVLHVGFIPLMDLYNMYREMGQRFFDRNIRATLPPERPANRAIRQSLSRIVLQGEDSPDMFPFNHNGVTLAAEHLEFDNGRTLITEPRLLNGAQTVASLAKFLEDNEGNQTLKNNNEVLHSIHVIAKIICSCLEDFVVNVTICNNRQNPVEPWHLRASDRIQLEFQDKFLQELNIYYERQENAFESLSDEDLEEMGFDPKQGKAIQIKRLAQAFLAVQGEIDKMSRLPDVFESDKEYKNTFRESYLRSDARQILLAYKIQFRIKRIIEEIMDKGANKYAYLGKARNLIWALLIQGLLNDSKLPTLCENFGNGLSMEANYSEILKDLASKKIRLIISDILKEDHYQEMISEEKYSFLRTNATYQRCMDVAYERYRWKKQTF